MSLEPEINHWDTHRDDPIGAALDAIETSLADLLAMDPAYWRTSQKKDVLAMAEKLLVDYATRLTASELRIVGRRILAEIDPERFEQAEAKALQREEERAQRRTFFSSHDNGDGTVDIHARLSRAVGHRLRTILDSLAQPRKWSAEDKGRKVSFDRLLGQAFARVVETYDVDQLPRHGGHATTVFITMSVDQLRNDIGTAALGFDGDQITAAEARRMACNADVIPVVLGSGSEILDFGHATRLAHPIQHRALRLRDKCCQAEAVTLPLPGPRPTTSNPGPPVAERAWPTWCCCVRAIIAGSMIPTMGMSGSRMGGSGSLDAPESTSPTVAERSHLSVVSPHPGARWIGRRLARVTDRPLRVSGRVAVAKTIGDRRAPLMY